MDGWSVWPQFKIIRSITRNYNTIWQTIQKVRRKYSNISCTPRMLGNLYKINKTPNKFKETNLKNLNNHLQENGQYQTTPQKYSAGSSSKIYSNESHTTKNVNCLRRSRRSIKYTSIFCINGTQKNSRSVLETNQDSSDIRFYNNYIKKPINQNSISRRYFSSKDSGCDRDYEDCRILNGKVNKSFWKTDDKKSNTAFKYKKREYHARIRSMELTKKQNVVPYEPRRTPTPKPYYSQVIKKNLKDIKQHKAINVIPEPTQLKKTVYDYTMFSKPEKVIEVISNATAMNAKNDADRIVQKQTVSYNTGNSRMREFIYPKKYIEKTRKIEVNKSIKPVKQASANSRKPSYLETSVFKQQLKKKQRKKAKEELTETHLKKSKSNNTLEEDEDRKEIGEWKVNEERNYSKASNLDSKFHVFNTKSERVIQENKPRREDKSKGKRLEKSWSDYYIPKKKDMKTPIKAIHLNKATSPSKTPNIQVSDKKTLAIKKFVGSFKNITKQKPNAMQTLKQEKSSYLNYIIQKHKQNKTVQERKPKQEAKEDVKKSKYSRELKFNTMKSYLEKDRINSGKAQEKLSAKTSKPPSSENENSEEVLGLEKPSRQAFFGRNNPCYQRLKPTAVNRNIFPKIYDWPDDIGIKESLYTPRPATAKPQHWENASSFTEDTTQYVKSDLEVRVPKVHGQWKDTSDPFQFQAKLNCKDNTSRFAEQMLSTPPENQKPFVSRSFPTNFLAENQKLSTSKKRREKPYTRDLYNLCKIFPPAPSYSEKYLK